MKNVTTLLLSVTAVASSLAAQAPIVLRGQVTDGSAAGCYYCPGYSHVFKYSGLVLASTTINLLPYHNQMCKITGTWNGAVVEVSAIEVTPETFSITGGGHIGTDMGFTSFAAPDDLAVNALSIGTACSIPFLDCGLQLSTSSLGILGLGTMDSSGECSNDVSIPNLPGLIGLRVFGQSLILKQDGTTFFSNIDAKELN